MKRNRKSRNLNQQLYKELDNNFNFEDTRYWGVFVINNKSKKIKIDPKRFQKMMRHKFDINQLKIINARNTHYFVPKKVYFDDYNCNIFDSEISEISKYWFEHYKGLIKRELELIEHPKSLSVCDYDNFQCGISSAGSAQMWAQWHNFLRVRNYKNECATTVYCLYAQFFHFMMARIEAVTIKVLTLNKLVKDRFDRNILYGTCVGKEKTVEEMQYFKCYDKMYCIWNFIKHNSLSTFKTLNERYPELITKSEKYEQGELAIYHIKFSDKLIEDLLKGIRNFYKEYCCIMFDENYDEAQWNYDKYFSTRINKEIEELRNPLGLGWWDD